MLANVLLLSVLCSALRGGEFTESNSSSICSDSLPCSDELDGSGQTPIFSLSSPTVSLSQSNISTTSLVDSSLVIETTAPLSPASSTVGNLGDNTSSLIPAITTTVMRTQVSASTMSPIVSSQAVQTTASTFGNLSTGTSFVTLVTTPAVMETRISSSTATMSVIHNSTAVQPSGPPPSSTATSDASVRTTLVESSVALTSAQTTFASTISDGMFASPSVASTSSNVLLTSTPFFFTTASVSMPSIRESMTSNITTPLSLSPSSSSAMISSSTNESQMTTSLSTSLFTPGLSFTVTSIMSTAPPQMTSSSSSSFFTPELSSSVTSVMPTASTQMTLFLFTSLSTPGPSSSTVPSIMPTTPTPLIRLPIAFQIVLERAVMAVDVDEVRLGVAELLGVDERNVEINYLFDGRTQVYPKQKRQADSTLTFDRVDASVRVTSDERKEVETTVNTIANNNTSIMIGGESVSITTISEITEEVLSSTSLSTSSTPAVGTDVPGDGMSTSSTPTIVTDVPGEGIGTGALAGIVLAVIFTALVVTVLVAILAVYFRHRSVTKSYEFDAAEMTYMKNSDVWKSDIPPD